MPQAKGEYQFLSILPRPWGGLVANQLPIENQLIEKSFKH
jgi:hypothetical protein